jgi:hypothetical protein
LKSILNKNYFQKLLKMPSWNAWDDRSEALLKEGVACKCLSDGAELID